MPCLTVVKADIYLADPLVAGEGYTCDICWLVGFELCIIQRCINASGRPDSSWITPATLLPIALVIRSNHLNARNPLHMFHPIDARNQQACGIAMGLWQCNAVHMRSN